VRSLAPGVVFGVGYFAPRTSNLVLREQLRAGDEADGSTWQFNVSAASTEHTGAAALGLRLSSRPRVGVSLVGAYEVDTESLSFFGSPGSAEGHFYGGTLGMQLGNEHRLAPGEAAQSLIFSTVFALRYAFSSGTVGRVVTDPDDETSRILQF